MARRKKRASNYEIAGLPKDQSDLLWKILDYGSPEQRVQDGKDRVDFPVWEGSIFKEFILRQSDLKRKIKEGFKGEGGNVLDVTFRTLERAPQGGISAESAMEIFCFAAEICGEKKTDYFRSFINFCLHKDNFKPRAFSQEDDLIKNILGLEQKSIKFLSGQETWLNPYNQDGIPFIGRGQELVQLDKFAVHPDKAKIWGIIGPSGSGKTRLVLHWIKTSASLKNWHCQFLKPHDREKPNWSDWKPEQPTLLILDYMFGFEGLLERIVLCLEQPLSHPVRLLVLDHKFSEPLENDPRWGFSGNGIGLDFKRGIFFKNQALELAKTSDQDAVIETIVSNVSGQAMDSPKFREAILFLKEHAHAYHPLFAALIGEALKKDSKCLAWDRRKLIEYYLEGERLTWKTGDLASQWASCFVAVATARRGLRYNDLIHHQYSGDTVFPSDFDPVISICRKIVPDSDHQTLPALEPDLLGESFFLLWLRKLQQLRNIHSTFYQMFLCGSEEDHKSGVVEFLGFAERLTGNLKLEDQSNEDIQSYWDAFLFFLNPEKFPETSLWRWAFSIAIIRLAEDTIDFFSGEKLGGILARVREENICRECDDEWRLKKSVIGALALYEIKASINRRKIIFSDPALKLFEYFNQHNFDQNTPLIVASEVGYEYAVRAISNGTVDYGTYNKKCQTALMAASRNGHVGVVRELLKNNPSKACVDDYDIWSVTSIIEASLAGHSVIAELLLDSGANIDHMSIYGITPLMAASIGGHIDVVQLLLDRGAKIDLVGDEHHTDKRTPIWFKDRLPIPEMQLIEDENGGKVVTLYMTALEHACCRGHIDVVRTLLENNAKQNVAEALSYASSQGYKDIMQVILDKFPDLEIRESHKLK